MLKSIRQIMIEDNPHLKKWTNFILKVLLSNMNETKTQEDSNYLKHSKHQGP